MNYPKVVVTGKSLYDCRKRAPPSPRDVSACVSWAVAEAWQLPEDDVLWDNDTTPDCDIDYNNQGVIPKPIHTRDQASTLSFKAHDGRHKTVSNFNQYEPSFIPTGSTPEDIVSASELIKDYCNRKQVNLRDFLSEFRKYATKYGINPTISNLAFYIQYQKLVEDNERKHVDDTDKYNHNMPSYRLFGGPKNVIDIWRDNFITEHKALQYKNIEREKLKKSVNNSNEPKISAIVNTAEAKSKESKEIETESLVKMTYAKATEHKTMSDHSNTTTNEIIEPTIDAPPNETDSESVNMESSSKDNTEHLNKMIDIDSHFEEIVFKDCLKVETPIQVDQSLPEKLSNLLSLQEITQLVINTINFEQNTDFNIECNDNNSQFDIHSVECTHENNFNLFNIFDKEKTFKENCKTKFNTSLSPPKKETLKKKKNKKNRSVSETLTYNLFNFTSYDER